MIGTKYCMGCMQKLSWDGRCSYCDFQEEDIPGENGHLPYRTMLKQGEYLVGRVLGEGGFGITYIGLDTTLLQRVAIKEFYPMHLAERDRRDGNLTVLLAREKQKDAFKHGLDSFLREGQTLARFSSLDAVAGVKTFFQENGTAYLVMEYVDGMSVKEYVKAFGVIDAETVLSMIKPVIADLHHMHEDHIFHRDISADNLIIDSNGKLKLIDFGSAKRILEEGEERTSTILYKRGYSALEQYSASGKQGGWTDVYGLCATVYFMLTANTPDSALERIVDDAVLPLTEIEGLTLQEPVKETIWKGMAVETKNRVQSMRELYQALYGEIISEATPSGMAVSFPAQENATHCIRENVLSHTRMKRELSQIARRRRHKAKRKLMFGVLFFIVLLFLGAGVRQMLPVKQGKAPETEITTGISTPLPDETASSFAENTAAPEGSKEPTAGSNPKKSGRPTASSKPKKSRKPAASSKPKKSKKPAASDKPKKSKPTAKPKTRKTAPPLKLGEDNHVAGDLGSME